MRTDSKYRSEKPEGRGNDRRCTLSTSNTRARFGGKRRCQAEGIVGSRQLRISPIVARVVGLLDDVISCRLSSESDRFRSRHRRRSLRQRTCFVARVELGAHKSRFRWPIKIGENRPLSGRGCTGCVWIRQNRPNLKVRCTFEHVYDATSGTYVGVQTICTRFQPRKMYEEVPAMDLS